MSYKRPLQWVSLTTAVLCTLWFAPSLLDPFNIPKLAILVVGAATLVGLLAGYVKQWWKRDELPVLVAAGVFLLAMTLAGFASPQNAYRTLWGAWARNTGWLSYATLTILLVSAALAFRGRDSRFVLVTLAGVGNANALYGVLQATGNDPIKWNNTYNPIIGTVGNPDFASALMGISVIALVWMLLDPVAGTWRRAIAGVDALFVLFVVYKTQAIQGLLAAAIGIVVVGGAWLTLHERERVRKLIWPWIAAAVVGAAAVILGTMQIGPTTKYFFKPSVLYRSDYYAAAIEMIKRKPIFGVGLDSYGDWFRLVRSPIQVARRGPDIVSNAAHNVVLQLGATAGLVTVAAYLALSGVVLWRAVVGLRARETRLLMGGLAGAWAAFWMQSLVSIDQLGLTVWGWVLAGGVIAGSMPVTQQVAARGKKSSASVEAGPSLMIAIGAACVLGLAGIAWAAVPLNEDSAVRTAISYQVDPKNPQQVQAVTAAIEQVVPGASDPYWRAQLVSALYRDGAIDAGIKLAVDSANQFPADVTLWQLAATAYEQTGRKALAVPYREKAVALDPLNADYAKLLADDKATK